MVEMDSLAIVSNKVKNLLQAEAEPNSEIQCFYKKRIIEEQRSATVHISCTLDMTVRFWYFDNSEEATNEAEVFLLPEELSIFTKALIQHPVLIPTNFSQQLSMKRGMFCMRLTSQESPEDFARRLSDALRILE